ncbi:zf-HC2 domain-containing protein [Streptomyces sp. SPB162]|uniref:zf-HC2 domain-containing protein n=1 Tax=Streptomyces sp. SPB162 TaxID=2940560 RepID=UPI002A5303D0|nr:anti-sigma factor RsiW [Streptomyces sp. SPB162]
MTSPQGQHADVGAYALGLLDDADATRFETHLAGCASCMGELDELAGNRTAARRVRGGPSRPRHPPRPPG